MHHQHLARGEIGEQIFRPASEAGHGLALQAFDEILRQRPAQVRPVHLDFGESRALHHWAEAPAHGFDFGKFGHGS